MNYKAFGGSELVFVSGPLLMLDGNKENNAVLLSTIGTWPLLLVVFSSAGIAAIIMWGLVCIQQCTLRKYFVMLQLYWWLFSSTKHCS